MTIPLPPLPEHLHHPELKLLDAFTREQVRAIQRDAMRVALDAAAKVCRDFDATDSLSNYGLVLARMIEELEIGT